MIIRLLLSSTVLLAAPLAAAQQATPSDTPAREQPQPLIKDLESARRAEPHKAPPGKLCLIDSPQPCGEKAELVQKPYNGGAELYYLERPPAKPEYNPPTAPSQKPPQN